TALVRTRRTPPLSPLLVNGDRLTQAEFHRRYEMYPEDVKFELIGGIVYMASPVGWLHARYHILMGFALELYSASTPGVEAGDNATTILGEESEPQPDLTLRILAEYGGQSGLYEGKYVQGAPELLTEIAHSTRAIDLHRKKDDYQQAGVLEYLVFCVEEQELYWYRFPSGRLLKANRQGIYRSQVFPGLWIDRQALRKRDTPRLSAVLQEGLASREHAAFVKRLQAARRRSS
ncbi:MAG: Uma2 family endonuclease, partial [Gemmataceae bacterium]|nr:Uma2 family endonuclease [Gemmataceae bacterium]